jgi:hypothetical protein
MLVGELTLAADIGRRLDALGVVWLIGGSVASSLLGEARTTADVDLVADLREKDVKAFCEAVLPDCYVDEDTARWAAATRRSFTLIDNLTITKIDIFCCKDDPLSRQQLVRRIFVEAGGLRLPLASPEDIILQKLLWHRESGGTSDRQLRDALGVARVHAATLDLAYMESQAVVADLEEALHALLDQREPR